MLYLSAGRVGIMKWNTRKKLENEKRQKNGLRRYRYVNENKRGSDIFRRVETYQRVYDFDESPFSGEKIFRQKEIIKPFFSNYQQAKNQRQVQFKFLRRQL